MLNSGQSVDFSEIPDAPHVIAMVLKIYLNEMSDSVIPEQVCMSIKFCGY